MAKSSFDKDFNEFKNAQGTRAPKEVSERVLSTVRRDLNPSHTTVFLKLLSIQAFVGLITLLFCPQFNLSLTSNYDLFHFFHHTFGRYVCMFICGSIFIGSGAIFASYILTLTEINKIGDSKFLYYSSISGISIIAFIFVGAEVYLDLVSIWFFGATVSGILTLEIGRYFKNKLVMSS